MNSPDKFSSGSELKSRSIPDDFRIIGGNGYAHEFELIVLVHPQSPFKVFPDQPQPHQLVLHSPDWQLFLAHQFHAHADRSTVLRHQGSEFNWTFLTL